MQTLGILTQCNTCRNGSKIKKWWQCAMQHYTESQSVTLIYVDGTKVGKIFKIQHQM